MKYKHDPVCAPIYDNVSECTSIPFPGKVKPGTFQHIFWHAGLNFYFTFLHGKDILNFPKAPHGPARKDLDCRPHYNRFNYCDRLRYGD